MKIVFLDSFTLNPGDLDWAPLAELGEFTHYERTSPDKILERSQDAQVLISNKVKLDREHLSQLSQLKCICIAATGYNNIDIKAAKELQIPVMNVSGYGTTAVAQQVFALLLALTNRVETYAKEVKEDGRWSEQEDFCYWDPQKPIKELANKTVGIYGMGKIGQAVAKIALAFDMQVIAVHKYPERDNFPGVELVEPEELFSQSDILSLNVPLNPGTYQLINHKTLAQMKTTALLINTSRGDLIHEADLLEALEKGQIAGAALDVLSKEPPPKNHPLFAAPNCLITPHQAWASQESRQRLLLEIAGNIKAFQQGKERNLIQ